MDVAALRANCQVNGFNTDAAKKTIGWFWEVLGQMSSAERCKFVRYEDKNTRGTPYTREQNYVEVTAI